VWVWYPAAPRPGDRIAPYVPVAWELALSYPGDWGQTSPSAVRPHAYENAPVAAGRFPVLVLAPGLGLNAVSYTTIAEDLASHGYVVAGANSTYSTTVVLSSGHPVPAVPKAADDADLSQLLGVWVADVRFVAGRVLGLDDRFADRIDPAHIGFLGHSLR
jgi:predicted dienelactone hydrolase